MTKSQIIHLHMIRCSSNYVFRFWLKKFTIFKICEVKTLRFPRVILYLDLTVNSDLHEILIFFYKKLFTKYSILIKNLIWEWEGINNQGTRTDTKSYFDFDCNMATNISSLRFHVTIKKKSMISEILFPL